MLTSLSRRGISNAASKLKRSAPGDHNSGAKYANSGGKLSNFKVNGGTRQAQVYSNKPVQKRWPIKEGEYLWGMNSVALALKCNHRHVHRLYLLDEDGRSRRKRVLDLHSLEETAKARDIPIEYLSKSTMNQMVGGNNTQGVVLEAGPVHVPIIHEPPPLIQSSSEDPPLIVALDEVHDTHNFGAILRSCLLFGVNAVVACENNSAPLSPVSSVSSAGALEVLAHEQRIFKASHLHSFLVNCKSKGYFVVGTHLEHDSISLSQVPRKTPLVVVIGNEGAGLRSSILKCCDKSIRIPMGTDVLKSSIWSSAERKSVDSLNVSVATGILLNSLMYTRTG